MIEAWDHNKKEIIKELNSIIKIHLKDYHVYLVEPRLNVTDYTFSIENHNRVICYGIKKANKKELLIDLIYKIIVKEALNYKEEKKDIVEAVLELCILNELATRITGKSHYLRGKSSLNFLKKQIYPYFLMYLGVGKENMFNFIPIKRK